jgi:hypothetical protein
VFAARWEDTRRHLERPSRDGFGRQVFGESVATEFFAYEHNWPAIEPPGRGPSGRSSSPSRMDPQGTEVHGISTNYRLTLWMAVRPLEAVIDIVESNGSCTSVYRRWWKRLDRPADRRRFLRQGNASRCVGAKTRPGIVRTVSVVCQAPMAGECTVMHPKES